MSDKMLKQIILGLSIFLVILIILVGIGITSSGNKVISSSKQTNSLSSNQPITTSTKAQYDTRNSNTSNKNYNNTMNVLPNKYTIVPEQDNKNYMWIERTDGSVIRVKREYNKDGREKVSFQGDIKALDIKIPRSEAEHQSRICFDKEVALLKNNPLYKNSISKCGKNSAIRECLWANSEIQKKAKSKCHLP